VARHVLIIIELSTRHSHSACTCFCFKQTLRVCTCWLCLLKVKVLHSRASCATALQELFLQEVAGRAHEVMLQDEQRKGNTLDYRDVGELQCRRGALSAGWDRGHAGMHLNLWIELKAGLQAG
jgi:hypothetical protein